MKKFRFAPKKLALNYWQIPLAIAFLCFGILLVAQYRSHLAYSNSLDAQTEDTLSTLVLQVMDAKTALQTEVLALQQELEDMEEAISSGNSTAATWEARIANLQTAIGSIPVTGPGISISITSESSQLMALDLIDLINELLVSGAEAISINNERVTMHTQIADQDRGYGNFGIIIDGNPLLSPVVIRAIGNPSTLETGVVFTGGIADALRLQQVYLVVRQEEALNIPAANRPEFEYGSIPQQQ